MNVLWWIHRSIEAGHLSRSLQKQFEKYSLTQVLNSGGMCPADHLARALLLEELATKLGHLVGRTFVFDEEKNPNG